MDNSTIARILRETAQLLELDGAMLARYRSYEKVAELISSHPEPIATIAADEARLRELPCIGEKMAAHIREILDTGDYSLRAKLLKKYPRTIFDLLNLQSLGPKRVAFLWSTFHAGTVEDLEKIAREGKLRDLPGFGEKSERNILDAIETHKRSSGRVLISTAEELANQLIAHITRLGPAIEAITPAGSLRRGKETIGDLDLIVTLPPGHQSSSQIKTIADHTLAFPGIVRTLAHGEDKISFISPNGMQVDVRFIERAAFGAALLYFTGSKEHNVALRTRAVKMGLTLNEYALSTISTGRSVARATEKEIYSRLGLDFIEPELRENTGEIEAAEEHRLPPLITLADIKGDLQMHTTASDGRNSIEEMAAAARTLGYGYIAITDHSKAVTVANGLDEKRMLEHIRAIHAARPRFALFAILAGIEVDILKNGSLDMDSEVLAQLDVVVASVHSYMKMESSEMTERLLAAIENPYTQIVAHPTGRLLLRREPFPFDIEKVFDSAHEHGVAFECNAYPDRLDLKDSHLRLARDRGVKIVISTDSHSATNFPLMKFGVLTARRAWIRKDDVLNTRPLAQFLSSLRKGPGTVPQGSVPQALASRAPKGRAPARRAPSGPRKSA
jgi:DNA polymerase (family 10)